MFNSEFVLLMTVGDFFSSNFKLVTSLIINLAASLNKQF